MTTTNHTPGDAPSGALGDATNWAENIVQTAINMRAVWPTAAREIESR